MFKTKPGYFNKVINLASVLVLMLLWISPFTARSVQAGGGTTVDMPASMIVPTLDGVCDPTEYNDAAQVNIAMGTSLTFPVYLKHTASDAYFCFGGSAGLPLPGGTVEPSVALYIDRNDDGSTNNADDFGIWMPYLPTSAPFAHYWGTLNYNGTDPGGWQAVKHQIGGGSPFWSVEFRVSNQTMGGWNHTIGLALFYHWWKQSNDDYSWPANGIWAAPQLWGNANLTTANVTIGLSATIPALSGQCGADYADASTIAFNAPGGTVTGYLKHSLTDLYVCLHNLTVPAVAQQNMANAALYINRAGSGGSAPGPDDLLFTISYNGTVQANSGDGSGFTGPDPGGYSVVMSHGSGVWDAEFRISSATIGKWFSRQIDLSAAELNVNAPGDGFGWPTAYSNLVPNTWGQANLTGLGKQFYLPDISR